MADYENYELFRYNPSLAGAIVFNILFILTTALHLFQAIRTRTRFVIPIIIGGIFEFIGYIGRAVLAKQSPNWVTSSFIVQSLTLLLAPALFAASIYMAFGRLVRLVHGQDQCLINTRWLTKIFVTGDVLSFLIQGAGGGIMAKGSNDSLKLGENIIIAGLIVQLLFFAGFVLVGILFDRRIRRHPTAQSVSNDLPWYRHMVTLYTTSILIVVRNVVRVVEYIQGNDGFILRHEVFLYVFDGLLMLAVMVIFNVVYLGEIKALANGRRLVGKLWNLRRSAAQKPAGQNEFQTV